MTKLSKSRRGLSRRAFVLTSGGAAAAALIGYALTPLRAAQRSIDVREAFRLAEKGEVVLVDIRRPDEWSGTGIPQYGVPIDMRRADFVSAVKEFAGGKPVALICAKGVRSRRATRAFEKAGVVSVIDVPEGMLGSSAGVGWLKAGLPTVPFSER